MRWGVQGSTLKGLDDAFGAIFRRVTAGEKPDYPRYRTEQRRRRSIEMGQVHDYVGETGEKVKFLDAEEWRTPGVRVERHEKVPDVMLNYGNRHGKLTDQFGGAHTGIVYNRRLSGSNGDVAG